MHSGETKIDRALVAAAYGNQANQSVIHARGALYVEGADDGGVRAIPSFTVFEDRGDVHRTKGAVAVVSVGSSASETGLGRTIVYIKCEIENTPLRTDRHQRRQHRPIQHVVPNGGRCTRPEF